MDIPNVHSSAPFSFTPSLSSSRCNSTSHVLSIDPRSWLFGDKTTRRILCLLSPTIDSDSRRREIFEYLQALIGNTFGIKVYLCGSVPLGTYLPHGDVDLTAVSHQGTSEDIASEICTLLKHEEKNNAKMLVKNATCVHAQVIVVKCTIGDIAVDISVNQTAGMSALNFLEQVDQFAGKDHLFKLSIILIKAWCYYESRILGGVHGLIATYALEIMVLHVINLFYSSLHCPLAVLYKFLEYYSTFDWDNYGIAINGLVSINSLREIEVIPFVNWGELLLTEEFLRDFRDMFLPSSRVDVTNRSNFPMKYLNILDPLRNDNNLGRSVSKGNFYRIRSALSYGAKRLSEILMLPPGKIGVGLEYFFINTIETNGKGKRVDVLDPVLPYVFASSTRINYNLNLLAGVQYGMWFDDYEMPNLMGPTFLMPRQIWNYGWGEMGQNVPYDANGYYYVEESQPSLVDSATVLANHFVHESQTPPRKSSIDNGRECQLNDPSSEDKLKSRTVISSFEVREGTGPLKAGSTDEKRKPRDLRLSNAASADEKGKPRSETPFVDNRIMTFSNCASFVKKGKSKGTSSSVSFHGRHRLNNSASVKESGRAIRGHLPPFERLVPEDVASEEDGVGVLEITEEKESEILESSISSEVGESSFSVTYSMDEFPHLPKSKPIPICSSPLAHAKHDQVKETSTSLDSTEFGSCKPTSPTYLSLSEAGRQSDSDGSVFLDALSELTIAVPEDFKYSSETLGKMAVPVQPLQLTDAGEFPPLGRPENPVIVLSKKEFPPLSACLKSQKRNKGKKKNSKRAP